MRVSDTERQRVIDELRRHCAAGRLDVDEYADRIEHALGASTLADLDRVLGDLPMLRIADPGGSSPVLAGERARGGRAGFGAWPAATGRLAASLVVLVTVAVVLAAVLLVVFGSAAWAGGLIVGWLVGLVQGTLVRRRRRA